MRRLKESETQNCGASRKTLIAVPYLIHTQVTSIAPGDLLKSEVVERSKVHDLHATTEAEVHPVELNSHPAQAGRLPGERAENVRWKEGEDQEGKRKRI